MAVTKLRGITQIMDGTIDLAKMSPDFIADNATWTINSNNLATITGIQDPVNPNDVANKQYVDSVAAGLKPTDPVIAVENTTNIDMTAGLPTIDGVSILEGQRVLLAAQSDAVQNGIWEASASTWSRPTDFPTGGSAASTFVFVEKGTTYADTGWTCTTDEPNDVIDTNTLDWAQVSSAAQIDAGTGLTKTGNTIDFNAADTSLTVSADDVAVAIGNTNGNSLETTATGVELRSTVTGDRTFNTGNFTINTGAGSDVDITGSNVDITATVAASITGGTGVSVTATTNDLDLEATAGNVTFSDSEVNSSSNNTPIPFAIRPTVDYGNGNGTSDGDSIDQFRSEFTDDAIVNAILQMKADIDNGTSKLTHYFNEAPGVTNGSPTVTLANLGTHPTDKVVNLRVYLNGARQNPGSSNDYTVDQSTGVITFTFNLRDNIFGTDVVLVDYDTQDA